MIQRCVLTRRFEASFSRALVCWVRLTVAFRPLALVTTSPVSASTAAPIATRLRLLGELPDCAAPAKDVFTRILRRGRSADLVCLSRATCGSRGQQRTLMMAIFCTTPSWLAFRAARALSHRRVRRPVLLPHPSLQSRRQRRRPLVRSKSRLNAAGNDNKKGLGAAYRPCPRILHHSLPP